MDEPKKLCAPDEEMQVVVDGVTKAISDGQDVVNISSHFLRVLLLENLILRKKLRQVGVKLQVEAKT